MEEQRTLEFTCLSAAGEKEPRTRRERRRKRRKKRIVQSPGSGSKAEEVSETASELRSSASTTELRDGKRYYGPTHKYRQATMLLLCTVGFP